MKNENTAPPAIKAEFPNWARARRGSHNPDRQTNPVWAWLAETGLSAYSAHEAAGSGEKQERGWCFERFGQSETLLADGKRVLIGGEHEDFCDPDFYIYNDVVIFEEGRVTAIFGYPAADFPPTDFHSATLVGDQIVIIGRLGYVEDRADDITPVFALNLDDYSISELKTSGNQPAWMHKHSAILDETGEAIICEGGVTTHTATGHVIENIGKWRLCLKSGEWSLVSEKYWNRWLLMRGDESPNELWEIEQISSAKKSKRIDKYVREMTVKLAKRGHVPNADLYERRYAPNVEGFDVIEIDFRSHVVTFEKSRIRFDEQYDSILVTVERSRGPEAEADLILHYTNVFAELEGVPYKAVKL